MSEKLSIVLFSGTVDKLMAASILATGAAAMGKDVNLFLTFWGLMGFRKDDWKTNQKMSADFAEYAQMAGEAMVQHKVPSWRQTLEEAMEVGNVNIYACGMTMDLFGLKLEHLEPIVKDIIGVAGFVSMAEDGQTLFI
ncbi:MAG TPA: DsrE/DsrF/DrsH-like family protein [Stenomitos sp.]